MSDSFVDFVMDQLAGLREVSCRRMFGGFGLYQGETFFAIVSGGRLYFKTDDETRNRYIEAGMGAFQPSVKQRLVTYYEVPVEVLEDHDELCEWAREAAVCAMGKKR